MSPANAEDDTAESPRRALSALDREDEPWSVHVEIRVEFSVRFAVRVGTITR
jgi:hypothetical protein